MGFLDSLSRTSFARVLKLTERSELGHVWQDPFSSKQMWRKRDCHELNGPGASDFDFAVPPPTWRADIEWSAMPRASRAQMWSCPATSALADWCRMPGPFREGIDKSYWAVNARHWSAKK